MQLENKAFNDTDNSDDYYANKIGEIDWKVYSRYNLKI